MLKLVFRQASQVNEQLHMGLQGGRDGGYSYGQSGQGYGGYGAANQGYAGYGNQYGGYGQSGQSYGQNGPSQMGGFGKLG